MEKMGAENSTHQSDCSTSVSPQRARARKTARTFFFEIEERVFAVLDVCGCCAAFGHKSTGKSAASVTNLISYVFE
jgi:hypothetical protein